MFALSKHGLRFWSEPVHRPQGRRSPVAFRPVLETLEDRNLLSPTVLPTPATVSALPPSASQQGILAPSPLAGTAVPLVFVATNQPVVPATGTLPGQASTFTPSPPFGFIGYPALQNPAVNARSALGFSYSQTTLPGLFLVGGTGGATVELPPNRPAQPPPPPPPPPPPAPVSAPTPIDVETPVRAAEDEVPKVKDEETRTPPLNNNEGDSTTGIDNLTLLAMANAPRLDDGDANLDTAISDLALATFSPAD
jgi:hypothetical protein